MDGVLEQFRFPLDDFQEEAFRHLLCGRNVVVCAPTGAGKTAIAEATATHFLEQGGKVIYTTPLKVEDEEGEEGDEAAAESVYAARVAAGAYTLQLLDMATAYLVSAKQKALRQKTLRTLYDTGHALHDVWAGVQEGGQP